jgi:predicted amidophosphoribosyltransferase
VDAFLRRVIAQREREQELELTERPGLSLPTGGGERLPSEKRRTVDPSAKLCPHCSKQLRKDNTRGACSKCLAAKIGAIGESRRKFRARVTELGLNGDEELRTLLEGWLAAHPKPEAS